MPSYRQRTVSLSTSFLQPWAPQCTTSQIDRHTDRRVTTCQEPIIVLPAVIIIIVSYGLNARGRSMRAPASPLSPAALPAVASVPEKDLLLWKCYFVGNNTYRYEKNWIHSVVPKGSIWTLVLITSSYLLTRFLKFSHWRTQNNKTAFRCCCYYIITISEHYGK